MTGCMRHTPTNNLFVLAGIQTTELRRRKAILSLACRAQEPQHLLHERLVTSSYKNLRQLKLRHSFMPAALEMLNDFA